MTSLPISIRNILLAGFAAATLLSTATAEASEWKLDPAHTTTQFSIRHMMVTNVRGNFNEVEGTLHLDEKDLTKSKVELVIDAASIDTRNKKRDDHLRSPDFFDVKKHPKIRFVSTKIQKAGKGKFRVQGKLTMHGVTKPVTLEVTGPTDAIKNPYGQTVRGFHATGKLNRKHWNLNWNQALETGGVLVGDEVTIEVDGQLVEQQSKSAEK